MASRRPRQTLGYLRSLFGEQGVKPQKRLGQNFLIDLNLHDVIVAAAGIEPSDIVLEVGTGAGALTTRLGELASAVLAVEVDPAMVRLTEAATAELPNVRLLQADALAGKNRLNPRLQEALEGLLDAAHPRFKLVANLPYQIATPLISNLLVHERLCPAQMVVTIQLELAQKMVAEPGTDAYGGLSAILQALASVEIIRTLPPDVFWPRPKVDSAIVRIVPDLARRGDMEQVRWYHATVRRLFLHRRKNLRTVIRAEWPELWRDKQDVDDFLRALGFGEMGPIRAEVMNVEEFEALAHALREKQVQVSREAQGG